MPASAQRTKTPQLENEALADLNPPDGPFSDVGARRGERRRRLSGGDRSREKLSVRERCWSARQNSRKETCRWTFERKNKTRRPE